MTARGADDLSTPSADTDLSELEDLAYLITAHRFRERGRRGAIGEPDLAVARPLAVFLLNEGYRRDVRPRGTVIETEGAWEYGVRHVAVDGWPTERVHVSLEDARADLDTCGMNCHLIRRSGAQAAGEWHPIDYTGEARS